MNVDDCCFLAALTALALLTVPTELLAQTGGGGGPGCPAGGSCLDTPDATYDKIGARLRLARDAIRNQGRDSPLFGPAGPPATLTEHRAGVSLRFRRALNDAQFDRLRELGVQFVRDDQDAVVRIGTIYLARIPWEALPALRQFDSLIRAEATWAPMIERPLEVTSKKVGASPLRRNPARRLNGQGTLVGDIDSSFDIFHPHLFRADGPWFRWIDVDGDGTFDPGSDGVDLDGDGEVQSDEQLSVLDATVVKRTGRDNADGELQPSRDWLYVDVNENGSRDVGPSEGFTESDPAYGEPLFVADDVDADGKLEPTEKIVQLDSSKFRKVRVDDEEYVRGENLIEFGRRSARGLPMHGTGTASILVGGQPRFHDRVGLAPKAEFVGYTRDYENRGGRGMGRFATQATFIDDAAEIGVDALVHEWTDIYSTAQDGSTNVEQAMDAARQAGTVQVTPLGNLNTAKKHVERELIPEQTVELGFQVDDNYSRGGRSYDYHVVWGGFWWRADHVPTFRLISPSGEEVTLDPEASEQSIDEHQMAVRSEVSPRQTHHLMFAISKESERIAPGTWRIRVEGIDQQDRLMGRISDRYSSWNVGVRWTQPTVDRGTMVYPSTADSAVGVAAYGGRHDQSYDGTGSEVGELRHFSGRGPRIDGERGADIAAPDDPYAAYGLSSRRAEQGTSEGMFRTFGGTSGAGPHVAAAFALLQQAHPDWGPEKLEERIFETAGTSELTPDAGSTPNRAWGYGKVDAFEAVTGEAEPATGTAPDAELRVRWQEESAIFEATGSSDPDDENLEYRFDYDYDGTWEREWRDKPRVSVTRDSFEREGRHLGRVEVRDELGHRDGASVGFEYPEGSSNGDTGPAMRTDAGSGAAGGSVVLLANESSGGCFGCRSGGGNPPASFLLFGLVVFGRLVRRD